MFTTVNETCSGWNGATSLTFLLQLFRLQFILELVSYEMIFVPVYYQLEENITILRDPTRSNTSSIIDRANCGIRFQTFGSM